MANLIPLKGKTPQIGRDTWLADDAVITGDVTIGEQCSIWFKTVIRGDVCRIVIGDRVNIQDGTIIHGTIGKSETIIGDEVSVGHGAILHGCTIHDRALVGMGAIVMDNVVVQSNVIVAAGALVTENKTLESGWIYAGRPAKKMKPISEEQSQFFITRTSAAYIKYASWYTSE